MEAFLTDAELLYNINKIHEQTMSLTNGIKKNKKYKSHNKVILSPKTDIQKGSQQGPLSNQYIYTHIYTNKQTQPGDRAITNS